MHHLLSSPTLVPAFGRDYRSHKEVAGAFASGKDFQVAVTGQYCSVRDFPVGAQVTLRYADLRRSTIVTVEGGTK